jgi:2-hydroxychromene-2-carboxylate isomerase
VLAGVQETSVKDRLVRENDEAIRKGVFGSPFFLADGEPFWGSDRMSLISTGDHSGLA